MTLHLLLLFATVFGAILVVGQLYLRRGVEVASTPQPGSGVVTLVLSGLGRLIHRPGSHSDGLRKLLFRAGYRAHSDLMVFHGIQAAGAIAAALFCGYLLSTVGPEGSSLAMLAGAGFGFLAPSRVLHYQVRARARRIRSSVPAALELMVLALEAGQTIDQAMNDTAVSLRTVYPDLSSEFLFCNLELQAGTGRTEALRRLAGRCGEEEVKKVAAILIDGERFGTSLGPALRTHARFLRTRMRQSAQERARKLSVKLVLPVFFLIFPTVMVVTLGPAYLQLRGFLGSLLN
jgi:tight adherence protein C